jgi:F-box protein, helicase, 18
MLLTDEQQAIISSKGNIKINAVAGSGKTTTLIAYAKSRPTTAKILYIAFNKSVRLEAARKFDDLGLKNVSVETAHSLAYKHIVRKHNYKVRPQGYTSQDIAKILEIQGTGDAHVEYIIANHINKFVSYFCNSSAQKVQDVNYLDTMSEGPAKHFVASCYPYIENKTRVFLAKMNGGEIEVTHDFYLKKFQLSNPRLYVDYILFDEAQDASPTMLDVVVRQSATKIIVGDTHQQIYSWRYAVNSLEQVNFPVFHLSNSFRFGPDIANLAVEILGQKEIFGIDIDGFKIIGCGTSTKIKTKAVIARTNLGLLVKAIEYVSETQRVSNIYFEGNINSYTYADEGASLYDVLNLYNNTKDKIRDALIKSMKDMSALEEYIKKTEDVQLGMMYELVKEYGNQIPGIIRKIKDKHIEDDDKSKAEMIFSTVHRCKGMEYDQVLLVNDFASEDTLETAAFDAGKSPLDLTRNIEEINLLYVAITRAKYRVFIPENLLPAIILPNAHVLKLSKDAEENKTNKSKEAFAKMKDRNLKPVSGPNYMEKVKSVLPNAYEKWTPDLDRQLIEMYHDGHSVVKMSQHFSRTKGAIQSRLKKLWSDGQSEY